MKTRSLVSKYPGRSRVRLPGICAGKDCRPSPWSGNIPGRSRVKLPEIRAGNDCRPGPWSGNIPLRVGLNYLEYVLEMIVDPVLGQEKSRYE